MSDYWKDNNIKKPQQIIVGAAVKLNDTMICGARHFDKVMNAQIARLPLKLKWSLAEQGFINQFGEFIARDKAMDIVKKNGQPFDIERNGGSDKELYSEGLY